MAQIRWLVMITLLVASRGWAKDLSAGFDPRQVPREAIEKLAPISVGGFDPQQMFSGLTPVAVPGDWAQALKPVEVPPDLKQALVPVHAYEAGLAIWWTKLVESAQVNPDEFTQWAAEHNLDRTALVSLLDSMPIEYPMNPAYKRICAAIWEQVGDDIDTYLSFPPQARMVMAVYLGVLGREENVKRLLETLPAIERMGGHVPRSGARKMSRGSSKHCRQLNGWAGMSRTTSWPANY